MKLSIIEVISIIASFQALLLIIYFVTIKGAKKNNLILSSILLIFVILIISSLLLTHGIPAQYLKIIIICNQFALLVAPLIYVYMNLIVGNNYRFKVRDLYHLIPFLVVISSLSYNFFILNNFIEWRSTLRIFCSAIFLVQSILYIISCIYKLKSLNTKSNIFKTKSFKSKLEWFKFILIGFICVWLMNMHTFIVLDLWKKYGMCPYMYSVYFLTLFIVLNTFVILTLRKSSIVIETRKYQNSTLSESDKKRYRDRLLSFIEEKKPYKNPNLTLAEFSKDVRITMCYLSHVINESYNQNFHDFINQYRIEESKTLLADGTNGKVNILKIAFEVGFNSKSTFNNAFKKFTGMTPKEYKKKNFHTHE